MTQNVSIPKDKLEALCKEYLVKELSLFGSALGNRYSENSDIDLLVDFLPQAETTIPDFIRLEGEFAKIFGRKVDLVPKNSLRPKLRESVLSNIMTLYAV